MPNLGPTELIIIAVILVLLFGAKKLPDAARSIGRSMRIFKSETAKLREDDETTVEKVDSPAQQQPAQPHPQQIHQGVVLTPEEQAKILAERERAQAGTLKDKLS
ncbi:twin-arginine translocase TatA/TatE family subunit [Spongiactinospora gelatinilytica]|uniref:Sec-independent protein translocase protein TatA n=1 Tax=Spongiactinospora gelatinilytica TaxID=2666298 RepID=A0A2W2HRM1_9ACTN|nr:Sec-independent protein translocase subunit TatA [Spongiactinospora gelatinilytica]PZG54265.1 twin-arginine translocase TatA/TatE family subunit [Spongiactinospora gelatinilytica]